MKDTNIDNLLNLLKKAEFLSTMEVSDMTWLASKATIINYPLNSFLFKAGQVATQFFIVKTGKVVIIKTDENGHKEEMAHFIANDIIGDFDFCRSAVYDADAVCAEESEILVFPSEKYSMEYIISTRPDIASRLLLCNVAMISSRVRTTNLLVSNNSAWLRQLKRQMYTDAATGLWIRAFIDDEIKSSIETPAAIITIKPDRFKELCDTWAHSAGDVGMEKIAWLVKDTARKQNKAWPLRLKSNETAIIVSSCNESDAKTLAEYIRAEFRRIDLNAVTNNSGFTLSASIAVSIWPRDGQNLRSLVESTSDCMMEAWRSGGDKIYMLSEWKKENE